MGVYLVKIMEGVISSSSIVKRESNALKSVVVVVVVAATLRYCYCRPGGILGYFPSGKATEARVVEKRVNVKKPTMGYKKRM